MATITYERETCPRCLGTGKHSYNAVHGDRCYGCGGHGTRLTKRGAAASQAVKAALGRREFPAVKLQPGNILQASQLDLDVDGIVEVLTVGLVGEYGNGQVVGTVRRGDVVEQFEIAQCRLVRRAGYSDAEKAAAVAVAAKFPGAAWLK